MNETKNKTQSRFDSKIKIRSKILEQDKYRIAKQAIFNKSCILDGKKLLPLCAINEKEDRKLRIIQRRKIIEEKMSQYQKNNQVYSSFGIHLHKRIYNEIENIKESKEMPSAFLIDRKQIGLLKSIVRIKKKIDVMNQEESEINLINQINRKSKSFLNALLWIQNNQSHNKSIKHLLNYRQTNNKYFKNRSMLNCSEKVINSNGDILLNLLVKEKNKLDQYKDQNDLQPRRKYPYNIKLIYSSRIK